MEKVITSGKFSETLFFAAHIPFFLPNGLRTGATVEVISDIHSVRTKPEVRVAGPGGLAMTLGAV